MSKIQKRWTADEELVLCSMRKNRCSVKEIAKALNRTPRSVDNKIHKLVNSCKVEKIRRCSRKDVNFLTKLKYSAPPKIKVNKIDYDEVAKRVAKNFGNIQAVFRQYAKEVGVSVNSVNNAYYNKSQNKTRIKDRVKLFMGVGIGGVLPANCKNTNEKPKRSNLWSKLIAWLPKSLLS